MYRLALLLAVPMVACQDVMECWEVVPPPAYCVDLGLVPDQCAGTPPPICVTKARCKWDSMACVFVPPTQTCQGITLQSLCNGMCEWVAGKCLQGGNCLSYTEPQCNTSSSCMWSMGVCTQTDYSPTCDQNTDPVTCQAAPLCQYTPYGTCVQPSGGGGPPPHQNSDIQLTLTVDNVNNLPENMTVPEMQAYIGYLLYVYKNETTSNLMDAGLDTKNCTLGAFLFKVDPLAKRVNFVYIMSQDSYCLAIGKLAVAVYEELKATKKVQTTNLLATLNLKSNDTPQTVWVGAEEVEADTEVSIVSKVMHLRRQYPVLDPRAAAAANYDWEQKSKLNNTGLSVVENSDWCNEFIVTLKCNITTQQDVCTTCYPRLRTKMAADPKLRFTLAQQCTGQTVATLLYLSEVQCVQHNGVYCLPLVKDTFYTLQAAVETQGVIFDIAALSSVLNTHCSPCVFKTASAMKRYDSILTFLGSSSTSVSKGTLSFINTVCRTGGGGMPCYPGMQTAILAGGVTELPSSQLCGTANSCKMVTAAARAETSVSRQRLELLCVNGDSAKCGDLYEESIKKVPLNVFLNVRCNLAVMTYTGTGACLEYIAGRNSTVGTVCSTILSMGCCGPEVLHTHITRGLVSEKELSAGFKELCGTQLPAKCEGTTPTPVPIHLSIRTDAYFLDKTRDEMIAKLRADVAFSVGLPVSSVTNGQLTPVAPDKVLVSFAVQSSPGIEGTLNRVIRSSELTVLSAEAMYHERNYDGMFSVMQRSSVAGTSGIVKQNAAQCSTALDRVLSSCNTTAIKLITQDPVASLVSSTCSPSCVATATEQLEAITTHCQPSESAPLAFFTDVLCAYDVVHSKFCYLPLKAELDTVSTAVRLSELQDSTTAVLCSTNCRDVMTKSYSRYEARMRRLGLHPFKDDVDAAYRYMVLQTGCGCLNEVSSLFRDPSSLVDMNSTTVDVCGVHYSAKTRSCIRRTSSLGSHSVLTATDTLPTNATGIFASQCVRATPTTLCRDRYRTASLPAECDPVILNGTQSTACATLLWKWMQSVGCCAHHMLEGTLRYMTEEERSTARAAYERTLTAYGITQQGKCETGPQGFNRQVFIELNIPYATCDAGCLEAVKTDVTRNTGLQRDSVGVTVQEGTTGSRFVVTLEADTEEDAIEMSTGLVSNAVSYSVDATDDWATGQASPAPTQVMDVGSVEEKTNNDNFFNTDLVIKISVGSAGFLLVLTTVLALRRKVKKPAVTKDDDVDTPLDLTEMGKVPTPNTSYYRGNSPNTQEPDDELTI